MGKTYLRYVPSSVHGVIASPGATIAVDPTNQLLFTPALENVGVWHVKRGVEVDTHFHVQ
jgi:U3 small nucleolar RNA-associated protein 12